jgi:hypothetical protein
MSSKEEEVRELLTELARREQLARRRAWLYVAVPIVIGLAWLLFTYWQVIRLEERRDEAAKNVEVYRLQAESYKTQAENSNSQLVQANQILSGGAVAVLFDDSDISKLLAPLGGNRRKALELAFALYKNNPEIKFKWGGKTPNDGFDTSGYIAYVLSQVGVLSHPERYYSGRLMQEVAHPTDKKETLEPGDIIYYAPSQVSFYLDERRCLGIVPNEDIIVTEKCASPEFTKYGKITYDRNR